MDLSLSSRVINMNNVSNIFKSRNAKLFLRKCVFIYVKNILLCTYRNTFCIENIGVYFLRKIELYL